MGILDNPDQRLTADISLFCQKYGFIITDLILAPFLISYYSYSAFSRSGWIGPVGMFALFVVSTIINKLLMSPIVNLTVEQERREGDFRFKHVAVRTNAESLAFHDTARAEAMKANEKLVKLCQVQQRLFTKQLFLDLATNLFDYLGSIASFLVISVAIFSGAYDDKDPSELAQIISENAFVCMYLIYQFSKLVDMSGTVSSLAGATHRIVELAEALAKMPNENSDSSKEPYEDHLRKADNKTVVSLSNADIYAPKRSTPLIENLTLEIRLGQNILITGRSSAGKSSILRCIRGLWSFQRGQMEKDFKSVKSFFLPQKPFFTDGSLRDQIVYPMIAVKEFNRPSEDEWIADILQELGLGDLIRRCGGLDVDPLWSWYDVLSPGEMQRLAFVRLFFHRPSLAFLDEATSALSADIEELLYQRCVDLKITLISVGHREGLKKFHSKVLHIGLEEGNWKLDDIN